jgi:hypothetical protein
MLSMFLFNMIFLIACNIKISIAVLQDCIQHNLIKLNFYGLNMLYLVMFDCICDILEFGFAKKIPYEIKK